MGLFKPARDAAKEDVEVVCDLDVILEKSVSFRLRGKTHVIAPITTEAFYRFVEGIVEIQGSKIETPEKMNLLFHKAVNPVCRSLSLKDVEQMTMIQKAALIQTLSAKIMGKSPEDPKKKH